MSFDILIVDDSKITRSALERMLRLGGLELGNVWQAENGAQALQTIEQQWIDLVLMDLNMPGVNGVEVVESMARHEQLAHTPVVVISSERRPERIAALRRLGVRSFISKPLRPEQLCQVVTSILGGRRG